ncbi:hypothetical protein QP411_07200 [Pseudoglutamicibacter cumminsii]|uniref:Uncharacterized protein n=1 Tax=Pseudoglutamicibacter cumminsii TaxID=156979 RepID=A0AAP4C7W6_9MICC|nr:hypothetical protein [Pseudoglutamicibacter cumminsii]MDK6274823.1 hypothetical protein [Pseudoglutamicibacter cumminsii]MDK7083696.1 hypothetical protein [Pseudoglutamicibacter cumminsii]
MEYSTGLKIFIVACCAFGSIFTGANGLTLVAIAAAAGAVFAGMFAVSEVARHSPARGFTIGIAASVFSLVSVGFVLTAATPIPHWATAVLAVIAAGLWGLLAVVHAATRPGTASSAGSSI